MRDRMAAAARKVGYKADLSELNVSTIHSWCNRLLTQNRHLTPLGNSYETLDDLTQLLFIFDNFKAIIGEAVPGKPFLGRWTTRWTAIEGARTYFDKITEELIDPERLVAGQPPGFLPELGRAFKAYRAALFENNRVDRARSGG
jgi:DNA helicase-2/ATP-dependent DNA helicase PcrA